MQRATTRFAPAARIPQAHVSKQAALFSNPMLTSLFDALPVHAMILNEARQIVFCNSTFQNLAKQSISTSLVGMRPGEALSCVHAYQEDAGCGTSEFCRGCGAAIAILKSLRGKYRTEQCRLLRNGSQGEESMDLQVFAAPFKQSGRNFVLFTVLDISHENRLKHMERIFFHDMRNLLTGMHYTAQNLRRKVHPEIIPYADIMLEATGQAVEQIDAQKALIQAEDGSLRIRPVIINAQTLLNQAADLLQSHEATKDIPLIIEHTDENISLETDPALLKRVLYNLLLNALEASGPGEEIHAQVDTKRDEIQFHVHNPAFIPPRIKRQIFRRSFSTKGQGRGLGTYSIRLLTECYLQGEVGLSSDKKSGTTFVVRLPRSLTEES